jgi:hypothetical protein
MEPITAPMIVILTRFDPTSASTINDAGQSPDDHPNTHSHIRESLVLRQ